MLEIIFTGYNVKALLILFITNQTTRLGDMTIKFKTFGAGNIPAVKPAGIPAENVPSMVEKFQGLLSCISH